MGWFKKRCRYQGDSNLQLFSKPLAKSSVIELKVLKDAICDFYYDMEVNYKIVYYPEEKQEDEPLVAH